MMEEGTIAKIVGILAGSFLSLVFDQPRSRAGAIRRAAASIVFGWVFGHITLSTLGWEENYNNIVAAFCLCSMFSWSTIGVLKRLVESYKRES